jgi:hypothetical protein
LWGQKVSLGTRSAATWISRGSLHGMGTRKCLTTAASLCSSSVFKVELFPRAVLGEVGLGGGSVPVLVRLDR